LLHLLLPDCSWRQNGSARPDDPNVFSDAIADIPVGSYLAYADLMRSPREPGELCDGPLLPRSLLARCYVHGHAIQTRRETLTQL